MVDDYKTIIIVPLIYFYIWKQNVPSAAYYHTSVAQERFPLLSDIAIIHYID